MSFPSPAPLRDLGAGRPMSLWQEDAAWSVATGFVDLFAVPVQDGQAQGRREFLFRVLPGEILCGLPLAEWHGRTMGVLAVGGLDTTVRRQADPSVVEVEGWVARLAGLAAAPDDDGLVPRIASPGGEELAAGDAICGQSRLVLWATVLSGRIVAEGFADTPVGAEQPPLALAAATRLAALEPARLMLHLTADLQASGTLRQALATWHGHAARGIVRTIDSRYRDLDERSAHRAELSEQAMESGFQVLAGVLGRVAPPPPSDHRDPALAVVRQVADRLGVTVAPPGDDVRRASDLGRITVLLKGAGLRSRTVLLRDGWWRQKSGPLIARREAEGTPVALLPRSGGGYLLHDPLHGGDQPVTAALAGELAPQALSVYPRLPPSRLAAGDLLRFVLRDVRGDAWRILALATGAALLALATPVASGLIIDHIIPAAALGQLGVVVAGLLAIAVCIAGFEVTKGLSLLRQEGQMDAALQAAMFDRLLRLPAPFFKGYSSGDLTDRVLGIQSIRQMLTGTTVGSLLAGVFSLISLGLLFAYSVPLAGVAILLAVVSIAITAGLSLRQLRHERAFARRRGQVEGLVLQIVGSIGKLRVAAAAERALGHWARRHGEQKRHLIAGQRVAALQTTIQAIFPPLAMMLIFVAVAMLGKQAAADAALQALAGADADKPPAGAMEAGSFLAFSAAFGQFLGGMTQLVKSLTAVLGVVPLYERARPVLDAEPEDARERTAPGPLEGGIEFSHVSFSYQTVSMVLRDLSFAIAPGEYVGLVGPSGSGKSTVLRLLLGLEDPGQGEILFDGKPLSRLNRDQVRRQVGVVLQNGRILPGSVLTNIVGSTDARLEDAWEAARLVGLDRDIRALPMGMHTVLMEGGGTLSGGQRQRLMIARALVGRPRLLLLDEATSALDNRTQSIVTETLAALPVTRVVIAHRLSTIEQVDRILVMDKGRLVQNGSYAELVRQPGLFADMARRQIL